MAKRTDGHREIITLTFGEAVHMGDGSFLLVETDEEGGKHDVFLTEDDIRVLFTSPYVSAGQEREVCYIAKA